MASALAGFTFTHLFTRRGTASYEEMTAYELLRGLDGDFSVYSYRCDGPRLSFSADFQEDEETGEFVGVKLEVLSPCCRSTFWSWHSGEGHDYTCTECNAQKKLSRDCWTGALVAMERLSHDYWDELYRPGTAEEVLEVWLTDLYGAAPLEAIVEAQEFITELSAMVAGDRYRTLAEPPKVEFAAEELTLEALQAFYAKDH